MSNSKHQVGDLVMFDGELGVIWNIDDKDVYYPYLVEWLSCDNKKLFPTESFSKSNIIYFKRLLEKYQSDQAKASSR
jgi:hypothetical protein